MVHNQVFNEAAFLSHMGFPLWDKNAALFANIFAEIKYAVS